jgi:hypothetical protein
MTSQPSSDSHLRALGGLLVLEDSLRKADHIEAVAGTLSNDVPLVVATDLAAVWLGGRRGDGKLTAVHGLPEPARDAPFTLWCNRLCAHLAAQESDTPLIVQPRDLPETIGRDWKTFLPSDVVWVPLTTPDGTVLGGMLAGRSTSWLDEERRLLGRLGGVAGHAMDRLARKKPALSRGMRLKPWAALLAVCLLAGLFVPVPLSVLAQAEIRSLNEDYVRASLQGVVGDVLVEPNQIVSKGALLLRFDDVAIRTRLAKALQDLEIAEAEFRQVQQTAMRDAEASSRQAGLAARVGQARAEVAYVQDLLDRVEVRAEQDGVAIIPDVNALPGRPVQLGERLMTISDPSAVEAIGWMAIEDALPLPEAAPARLYLNAAPDRSLAGTVRQIDYRAQEGPGGIWGFRVVVNLDEAETVPRIGSRGTLRLEAGTVPLGVLVFRRPWAAIRPWLGL